ncbi:SDR family oxidoreductase [Chitinophagaceae bacterium MMS25-I14]
MNNQFNNYILTGVTGILGSHILYELMLEIHNNNYNGHIVLLARSGKGMDYRERFNQLFREELVPDYLNYADIERIKNNHITLIDFDLRNAARADFGNCLGKEKYVLIHCAASVNLGTNNLAYEEIRRNNYQGTIDLIHSLHPHLKKVVYISTAFSLSNKNGTITENHTHTDRDDFRNHYEKFKVLTEQEVKRICESYGLAWQISRPSIICGRLVDAPHHVIPRFLVFYLFGAFFYRARAAYGDQHIRILMNATSGLNLVPVDYAAKAIVRALHTNIRELNVVSRKSVPNSFAVPEMLRNVGWTNYELTEEMPETLNPLEKLYYRTAGAQLSNYLNTPETPETEFNTSVLSELMQDYGEPQVADHFTGLCSYAVENTFSNLLS